MIIHISALFARDIDALSHYVPEDYRSFFADNPGVAPYRLLLHLSTLFTDQTLVEVGVHNGWGSLCLGHNRANRVVGYDIDLSTLDPVIGALPNLSFHQRLAHEDPATVLSAPLIHFDALHDGVYEETFYAFLVASGYRGLLLLDDIRLNREMKRFWGSITLPKHDLTQWGHSTGTGLVCFGGQTIEVKA